MVRCIMKRSVTPRRLMPLRSIIWRRTIYLTIYIYGQVYHEEERHTEAVDAAKNYYMAENEVNCENLRANSFRLREEEVSSIAILYFLSDLVDYTTSRVSSCLF